MDLGTLMIRQQQPPPTPPASVNSNLILLSNEAANRQKVCPNQPQRPPVGGLHLAAIKQEMRELPPEAAPEAAPGGHFEDDNLPSTSGGSPPQAAAALAVPTRPPHPKPEIVSSRTILGKKGDKVPMKCSYLASFLDAESYEQRLLCEVTLCFAVH